MASLSKHPLFEKDFLVKLGDTDAAGRIYFASPARWFHDLWEELLDARGLPLGAMLEGSIHLPVVNCEIGFKVPLRAGDKVRLVVGRVELGEKSLTVYYEVQDPQNSAQVFVMGTITHVCVDAKTGRATSLPEKIRSLFN